MARSARKPHNDKRTTSKRASVVGSTLGDASNRLRARGIPKSGIPKKDGLKVAEGALPDTTMGFALNQNTGHRILRVVAIVSGTLAVILLIVALGLGIISRTGMFRITAIETYDTEHVSATDVAQLVRVEEGSTLLNYDAESIKKSIQNNPWIGSVEVQAAFPDKLVIRTTERKVGALVSMGSGGVCWLIGDDGVWIEPLRIESVEGESSADTALGQAERLGVVMISGVPGSVSPDAGTAATDDVIVSAQSLNDQLPDSFKSQVASISSPDTEGLSCILKSGVEVSFGNANSVETKVAVAEQVLEEFPGQITYVNVRVPSRPTYRRIESKYVDEGTGATGVAIDEESDFASMNQRTSQDDQGLKEEVDEIPEEYLDSDVVNNNRNSTIDDYSI